MTESWKERVLRIRDEMRPEYSASSRAYGDEWYIEFARRLEAERGQTEFAGRQESGATDGLGDETAKPASPANLEPVEPPMITGDEWTAIQSRVDHDCPMNIVADLGNQAISWSDAADRIINYTESAYIQGRAAIPSGMVLVSEDALEGFVRTLEKTLGQKDRGDISPSRIIELARAMLNAARKE